jgi:hypothetical protein
MILSAFFAPQGMRLPSCFYRGFPAGRYPAESSSLPSPLQKRCLSHLPQEVCQRGGNWRGTKKSTDLWLWARRGVAGGEFPDRLLTRFDQCSVSAALRRLTQRERGISSSASNSFRVAAWRKRAEASGNEAGARRRNSTSFMGAAPSYRLNVHVDVRI